MSITTFGSALYATLVLLQFAHCSKSHEQLHGHEMYIPTSRDTSDSSDTTLIPSNAEYRVALSEGSLIVRVTTHSFDRITATLEVRDKYNRVLSEWNATLRNQDHQEIETSDGPNGTAYNVMLFGCTKPYPIELRVPDEDGQWLYWLRISIVHPMIPRSGLKKVSLILLRQ